MLTPKRDPFSPVLNNYKSNTPKNSGDLEDDQHQWHITEGNKVYLGDGRYGDLRNSLGRASNPIKDIYDDEGMRIGAYNTQTGKQYGLQGTNRTSTGTESIIKSNQDNLDSSSPSNSPDRDPFSPVQISPNNNVGSKSDLTVPIEPGGIAERIKNNQNVVNSGSPSPETDKVVNAVMDKRDYISPSDVAKMNPSGDNSLGEKIGGTIGGLLGGTGGFISGGTLGLATANPIGLAATTAAGTLAGAGVGNEIGGSYGGNMDYFVKGLGETFNEKFDKYIGQNKDKVDNPANPIAITPEQQKAIDEANNPNSFVNTMGKFDEGIRDGGRYVLKNVFGYDVNDPNNK